MLSALLLVAATAADTPKLSVAVTDFTGANVSVETLASFSEHLASELRKLDLNVITSRDIAKALGIERQKQLLGCSTEECNAELVNALGADGVLSGSVSHLGDLYLIDLKIIASGGLGTLATFSASAGSERAVVGELDTGARTLSLGVHTSKQRPMPEGLIPKPTSTKVYALIPGGIALALAVTGAVLMVFASHDYDQLTGATGPITLGTALMAHDQGNTFRWAGVACFSVAVGALVAAGTVALFGGTPKQTVSLAPMNGGAALAWTGVFP
jgi:hypothetical protein